MTVYATARETLERNYEIEFFAAGGPAIQRRNKVASCPAPDSSAHGHSGDGNRTPFPSSHSGSGF